jgi:hypothetical protein
LALSAFSTEALAFSTEALALVLVALLSELRALGLVLPKQQIVAAGKVQQENNTLPNPKLLRHRCSGLRKLLFDENWLLRVRLARHLAGLRRAAC